MTSSHYHVQYLDMLSLLMCYCNQYKAYNLLFFKHEFKLLLIQLLIIINDFLESPKGTIERK